MARSSILGTLFARRSQTSEHRAALIPDRPTNIPPGTGRSCGWRQFHFSFLIRRKPQSKSLARALAQLMERQLQSTGAGIWALSWLRALNGASKQEYRCDPRPACWRVLRRIGDPAGVERETSAPRADRIVRRQASRSFVFMMDLSNGLQAQRAA